jgi:hypothetical protein
MESNGGNNPVKFTAAVALWAAWCALVFILYFLQFAHG